MTIKIYLNPNRITATTLAPDLKFTQNGFRPFWPFLDMVPEDKKDAPLQLILPKKTVSASFCPFSAIVPENKKDAPLQSLLPKKHQIWP